MVMRLVIATEVRRLVPGAIERGGKVPLDAGVTPDRETLRAFIAAKLAETMIQPMTVAAMRTRRGGQSFIEIF